MTVQLVIDTYNIDKEEALVVDTNEASIQNTRQKITQHLINARGDKLRIRLKTKALLNRFSDFEGLNGVLQTQTLIPRQLLADVFEEHLPDELTNELIVQLDLLKQTNTAEIKNLPFVDKLLISCHRNFLSKNFYDLVEVLKDIPSNFLALLKFDSIQQRLDRHLRVEFDWSEDVSFEFLNHLANAKSTVAFLNSLAFEQHQELLRACIARYQLNLPLPARALPASLLSIPTLPLSEQEAKDLPEKWLRTLDEVARRIERKELDAVVLVDILVSPWPILIREISELTGRNSRFVIKELIEKLESFSSETTKNLAIELSAKLALQTYPLLPEQSTVDEMLEWSVGYFESVRQSFISGQVTFDDLSQSFANWLLLQKARIARSDHDWRAFSQRVERYLKEEYLVVICMVDALSSLHQDLLDAALSKVDHLEKRNELLVAPLPTLTEIGKASVLTGIDACQLPQDQEMALREKYSGLLTNPNALKIIKSWKTATEHISAETQLLVYYENRIDERLHDCVDFSKHRRDVASILNQIAEYINRWKKDAGYLGREVVFFITADHGMTLAQLQYQGEPLGEVKERVFKVSGKPKYEHDGFRYIKINENGAGYLVPISRIGLTKNAVLTHGGLTPEEVMIPFITLTSKLPQPSTTPLEVRLLNERCQRIADRKWQVEIELMARVTINNIQVKFEVPFVAYESVDTIRENKAQKLFINFSSNCEQSGLIEIGMRLTYERDGAHETNNILISCHFPEPLIEKDAETLGFEDMFN